MAYITRPELIKRFGKEELIQLTDRDDLGRIDDAVLNECINDASSIIDSKLRSRYTLPLAQELVDSSPIKRYCGDIVRYLLMDDGATEEIERRNTAAMRWLNDVATGNASLGEQDDQAASSGRLVAGRGKSNFKWNAY